MNNSFAVDFDADEPSRSDIGVSSVVGSDREGPLRVRRIGLLQGAAVDEFGLRSMQRVQLVRILTTLSMKATSEREPLSQPCGQRIAGLSLDVANNSTEPAAQLSQLPSHPSELPGVRVVTRLLLGARSNAGVALALFDAVSLSLFSKLLAGAVQQSTVGLSRDRLGLYRRVHHDRRKTRSLDRIASLSRLDRLGQQAFDPFLSNPLPPAHKARRIAQHIVLEVQLAARVLVTRVPDLTLDHFVVAERVDALQVQQPSRQPRRRRRPPCRRYELRTELPIEHCPINLRRQLHQLVPRVDDVHQFLSKQVVNDRLSGPLGSQRFSLTKLQGFDSIKHNSFNQRHPESLQDSRQKPIPMFFSADEGLTADPHRRRHCSGTP